MKDPGLTLLRQARLNLYLSLEDLAGKLDISVGALSRIETRKGSPASRELENIIVEYMSDLGYLGEPLFDMHGYANLVSPKYEL